MVLCGMIRIMHQPVFYLIYFFNMVLLGFMFTFIKKENIRSWGISTFNKYVGFERLRQWVAIRCNVKNLRVQGMVTTSCQVVYTQS